MTAKLSIADLSGYHAFIDRVDQFCNRITSDYAKEIVCRAGCSSCCRHISLFPLEAAAVAEALVRLPKGVQELLASRAEWSADDFCPLLVSDQCVIYQARPLICRTHGLPLLIESDGIKRVDFCGENFRGVSALPGGSVIDLEILNSALATLNSCFAAESLQGEDPCARVSMAEIIKRSLVKF